MKLPVNQPGMRGDDPWLPSGLKPLEWNFSGGLNTQPARMGIENEQAFICDGWMPLGKNNSRTLYGKGTKLCTSSVDIVWMSSGNIGTTTYIVYLNTLGNLYAVNTNTSNVTPIITGIANPDPNSFDMVQAGNQYFIFVAAQTNGLIIWDGQITLSSGSLGPDVTILNTGNYYTYVPTMTVYGGTGSGATVTGTIVNGGMSTITVTTAGTGYTGGDGVIILFNGGNGTRTAKLSCTLDANGGINGITIDDGGLGYTSTLTGHVIGGGGFGGTFTATTTNGFVSGTTIVTPGIYAYPPTLYVQDSNNAVAVATITTMPFGVGGTNAEIYQGRLWVANGSSVLFTAATSITDFSTLNGGGAFQSTDSSLKNKYIKLLNANSFLYLVGDSSISAISNVQQSGGNTTFRLSVIDPEIGSPWKNAITVVNRSIYFANANGIHICDGGQVRKVSDPLDGIYPTPAILASFSPSTAKATIFGRRVFMTLLPMLDQVTQQQVNRLFMTDSKIWWTSLQDMTLTYVTSLEINSVYTAYGTNGRDIYPLFQQPSTTLTKILQSKLTNAPGYEFIKTASRLFGIFKYNSYSNTIVDISIDNENVSYEQSYTFTAGIATWYNASGSTATWYNAGGSALLWTNGSGTANILPPTAIGQQGVLLGVTLTTNAADLTMVSLAMSIEPWGYRG